MPTALLSVSDKRGLVSFARGLHQGGWRLVSTGGTARALREADLPVTEVAELTGHPEMMEGRVKTLHPAVHAGILARPGHAEDAEALERAGYAPIDLVAVNLYPFGETAARRGVTDAEVVEQIDVGGPTLVRAAAKNHERVWVVVRPEDYDAVLAGLARGPGARDLRRALAGRAFAHTAAYDGAIARHLAAEAAAAGGEDLPPRLELSLGLRERLRYGENPGQAAALYAAEGAPPAFRQLHGKALSYNNLVDLEAGRRAIAPWAGTGQAACAIIKHDTPCGIAVGEEAPEAYRKALGTDPTSAFGSVVVLSHPLLLETATLLRRTYVEVVAAPELGGRALELLRERKGLRLLELAPATPAPEFEMKAIHGGVLVQEPLRPQAGEEWRVVTRRAPTETESTALRFAWQAVAAVKSNAILLARDGMAIGIGAGQMSRVDAAHLAVRKAREAGHDPAGAVLASDAFFPFRDGLDAAAAAGIAAVVQPGGSVRDEEVVSAADEHGIAMVMTGRRLFRH